MKKNIIFLIILSLVLTSACTNKVESPKPEDVVEVPKDSEQAVNVEFKNRQPTILDVDYNPRKITPMVPPYRVSEDLSNIVNIGQFGDFSPEMLELLKNNNFVVNPAGLGNTEQLFFIYEDNQYKEIPSFITTDSVLQVYHIFYSYTLRTLENEKLLGILENLTTDMLNNAVTVYEKLEDKELKEAQLKNIAFFTVAQIVLEKDLPSNIPSQARNLAEEEVDKINQHSGFSSSSIFPYDLDYSQYTVRGHYTRSENLSRYFKAMMWYGQAPFPLYLNEEYTERNIEQTLQALLITYGVYSEESLFKKWELIYEPTNFFVGKSDDLNIYQYADLIIKVYGENFDINDLSNKEKLDKLYEEVKSLPEPRIKAKYSSVNTPVGKQFRFMGQRYVMDAEIIQELTEPMVRPIPSGLDIIGVMGSERAKEIQMDKEENKLWDRYPIVFDNLVKKFAMVTEAEWRSNMYQGWLWTLKGFTKPFSEGYPSFMTNEAWTDKDLNTALGSWSELKHDTILYGKQSGAEMGGGGMPAVGYVEPNVEVYEKLLWLTKFSRANLNQRGIAVESIDEKMEKFEELLQFLIHCSIKELNNEVLTEDEYFQIGFYGGTLESLSSSFAGDGIRWFEITSDTDRNMAVIADFHTIAPNSYSEGGYMEAGVGEASEIYVVVPIDGKLYLTRGAIFSYHEFISPERLTDESWQKMIKDGTKPDMPTWTNSFTREGKGEIPYPEY